MSISYARRSWLTVAAFALLLSLLSAATPAAMAQSAISELDGAPVDIHTGTCEDITAEPAFDAGAIVPTTLDENRDDERFQSGILVDDEMGVSGVDINNDDAIEDNEIIAVTGEDAEIGYAESPEEVAGVDTEQPHVVAVHASAEAYDTIWACGSLTDAEQDDAGRTIIPLQSVGDASIFGFSVMEEGGTLATYVFIPGAAPAPGALASHPVDVHPGTCADWTLEPTYDLGEMQETNVAAEGAQAPGDMSGEIPAAAENLGPVYKADAENEFEPDQLLNEGPFMVGVHESEDNYDTLVACGEVLPIYYEDQVLVILKPVAGGNMTGMVTIDQEDGTSHAFLWDCMPVEQATHPDATPLPEPTPTPEPTPSPTPAPTPTPEPTPTEAAVITETEVIVETVVIEETEVVPAPTATALAEQEGSMTVELGDESPGALTSQVGQTLMVNNPSDAERIFSVQDLGVEEIIPAGEQVEVQVPDDAEAGTYTYQVLEGEETLYEGELTVE